MKVKFYKTFKDSLALLNTPMLGFFYQILTMPLGALGLNTVGNKLNAGAANPSINFVGTYPDDPGALFSSRSRIYPLRTIVDGNKFIISITPPTDSEFSNLRYSGYTSAEPGFTGNEDIGVVLLFAIPLFSVQVDRIISLLNDDYLLHHQYSSLYRSDWIAGFIYADSVDNPKTELVPGVVNQLTINVGTTIACDFNTNTYLNSMFSNEKQHLIKDFGEGLGVSHWASRRISGSSYPIAKPNEVLHPFSGMELGRYNSADEDKLVRRGSVMMDLSGVFSA